MTCTHTKRVTKRIEEVDYWTGEIDVRFEEVQESTQEDIDLHRFKCTQCGEIGYYSGRARDFYENGNDPQNFIKESNERYENRRSKR